jgi:DHA2 family multidrug resistance protein
MGKIDLRLILLVGFSTTILAQWQMTYYSLDLSQGDIIWPGVIQGVGLGLVFVPLSAATFATLSAEMRSQGTAIFSLLRNLGSSIGISMAQTVLVRNTISTHAALVERIRYDNPGWNNPAIASAYDLSRPSGAAALDAMINQQASMIAYTNDFRLMLFLTIGVLPLLLLIRTPRSSTGPVEHAVMD